MKLPSTKLNLGDSLWSMSSNKPTEWIVEAIKCCVTDKSSSISYDIHTVYNIPIRTSVNENSIGYNYFKSKQELLVHLFEDCLTEGLVVK